jgi:hypothetical protein
VAASPRFLHVANGTSTTDSLSVAGIPGQKSIWADPLHDGPVPGGMPDDELLRVRARHLASAEEVVPDVVEELSRWRDVLAQPDYDELVLWFEHDLFDQLNLIQLLSHLAPSVSASRVVSLICIGSFPGRPAFKGLGELTPQEIAPLLHVRQPVTDGQYSLAIRAWTAFRATNPTAIEEVLRQDTSPLPFLSAALRRFLEDYPWTTDGLSRTERRLLQLVQSGPLETWTAFPKIHEGETAFYIGDGSFWQIVTELSSATPPLLSIDVAAGQDAFLPRGTVALTGLARDVLGRREDRIRRCGIDRWQGGVHLQGSGPLWRWDPDASRLVEC